MDAFAKLGIDAWGIVLYLGNFGVLLWLMHRFVYKPLVKIVDERRGQIKENIEQAEKMRDELTASKEAAVAEAKEKEAQMQSRFAEAKKLVKEEAAALLADAEERREALLTQAHEQAASVKEGILADAEGETKKRIEQVVLHVLKEGVPQDVVQQSVNDSWKTLEAK